MTGMTFEKLLILLVIAAFIIGPTKLPAYAQKLAQFTKKVKAYIYDTRDRLGEEMGEDFSDTDWRQLDPRQYDPRRIIRDALKDEPGVVKPVPTMKPVVRDPEAAVPWDNEAT